MFSNLLQGDVYPQNEYQEACVLNDLEHTPPDLINTINNESYLKIRIPSKSIGFIQQELAMYGFNKEFIYPELPSYTEQLQKRLIAKYS